MDNHKDCPDIAELFDAAMLMAQQKYAGKKVKEDGDIIPYREAFRACGINPNKYPCSIEALFSRIAKGSNVPHINALVDLNNAISLKTTLPLGTHDLGDMTKDITIRMAKEGDQFVPFGATEPEQPDMGEVVYAVENDVRTRRWTWRQSEHGKITEATTNVFSPLMAL